MITDVEMDENQIHNVRRSIFRQSKKLIGWALGRRDTKTLIKMYDSLGFKEFPHVYSDRYESYKEFFSAKYFC